MKLGGKELVLPAPPKFSESNAFTPVKKTMEPNSGRAVVLSGRVHDQEASPRDIDSIARCARDLFSANLALCVRQASGYDLGLLPNIERQAICDAAPKRQSEFYAGRIAAKEAVSQLGIENAVIPMCADKSPQWPSGVIGSIAHSAGIAMAVAGRTSDCKGIGVDIEGASGLFEDIWSKIFIPSEIRWLSTLPPSDRARSAVIIFCVKESFYKFQYPMTRAWLDFLDVGVTVHLGAFRFTVSSPTTTHLLPGSQEHFHGGYGLVGGYTIAGLAM